MLWWIGNEDKLACKYMYVYPQKEKSTYKAREMELLKKKCLTCHIWWEWSSKFFSVSCLFSFFFLGIAYIKASNNLWFFFPRKICGIRSFQKIGVVYIFSSFMISSFWLLFLLVRVSKNLFFMNFKH